mgnify:CR=1 FL=1
MFHAAKLLETCDAISKDLGEWEQVATFTRCAGEYYGEAGKVAAGAALVR